MPRSIYFAIACMLIGTQAQATQDIYPIPMGQAPMADSVPVTMASDQPALPVTVSGTVTLAGVVFNYGASSAALRTAAQIGNATGAADFGAGNASAQTVRTVIATDQAKLPVEIIVAGIAIDPRDRNWALASGTDSVTANIGTAGGLALDTSVDGLEASASSIDTKLTSQATAAKQDAQTALLTTIDASATSIDAKLTSPVTVDGTVTADQGAATSAAGGWPVKPTDGTDSQDYTAAGEAKVSVTQPLPAGTNTIGAAWIVGDTDGTKIGNVGDAAKVAHAASTSYVQGTMACTGTEAELKVGASRLTNRLSLGVHNTSNATIYIGPTGVTTSMRPLFKDQFYWSDDANLAVYCIAASGSNTVAVEEKGN